jgi:hypothetical protein
MQLEHTFGPAARRPGELIAAFALDEVVEGLDRLPAKSAAARKETGVLR